MPAAERGEPGQQLVQHGDQRVDVHGGARRQALDDLGGHVVRRADDSALAAVPRLVDELGDAEVGDQRPRPRGGGVEQDVLRLDVAVHDARGVGDREAAGHLGDDRHGLVRAEAALALQVAAQVGAADEVHHEGDVAGVGAPYDQVPDTDDVGVLQAEERVPLVGEALGEVGVRGEILAQHLHGDGARRTLAEPHRSGAAAAEHAVGGVVAADVPCHGVRLRRR